MAVATMLLLMPKPSAKALFGHTEAERQRRVEAEQQLAQEQQRNGTLVHNNQQLYTVISVLSAGAVVMFITGAAIGSKTRRDHAK